jgi:hypothetical protein
VASVLTARASADDRSAALGAREVLSRRCFHCHGANGVARKNIFVLDRDRLFSSGVVVPGDAGSPLLKAVESGAMPAGGPQLTAEEKAALRDWVTRGAPDWETGAPARREFISEANILALIRDDLLKATERSRPFLRYFSLAHLYNAGAQGAELETYRLALAKLVNSLSWHREITVPATVDATGTLLRIDLRDYNWTAETWDRILSLYPYAVRTRESELIARLSASAVAYVRADWFAAAGSLPPLYHDILGLPKRVEELEKMLAVDAARNLAEEKNVVRAGIRASGVSQNNRVLERHVSPLGAYWKSFDYRSNLEDQNIFNDPIGLNPAGGEIIFNLPNGLQAYLVIDARGNRIDRAPIEIVADRNNPEDPVIQNGRSCMSCHYAGMKSFKDDLRAVISDASTGRFDRDKALTIYPEQEALDRLVERDRERFLSALGRLGGPAVNSAAAEPINALSRRFAADLTAAQAAAEIGLEAREFQELVRLSARLVSSGFGQLLGANGGIKRSQWERGFAEIVGELQIGIPASGSREAVARAASLRASAGDLNREPARRDAINADPTEILKTARTLHIWSGTVYLNSDRFEHELRKRAEFQSLGLTIVKDPRAADLTIKLGRPLFTFTFTFNVTHTETSVLVTSGKVTAFDGGAAAPRIAKELLKRIQAARAFNGRAER